ncbi:MAG: hypothetical protein KKF56_05580 [Nanoarchaeota archaeon]|nr:hypothetical protein [Nanoarchaeota archaeon]
MKKKEQQIENYWNRINKLEGRIEELSLKGVDYSIETKKRKSLLQNVKRLDKLTK